MCLLLHSYNEVKEDGLQRISIICNGESEIRFSKKPKYLTRLPPSSGDCVSSDDETIEARGSTFASVPSRRRSLRNIIKRGRKWYCVLIKSFVLKKKIYGYFLFFKNNNSVFKTHFLFLFYLFRACCIKMIILKKRDWDMVCIGILLYCCILCWLEIIYYEINLLSCSLFYQWFQGFKPVVIYICIS